MKHIDVHGLAFFYRNNPAQIRMTYIYMCVCVHCIGTKTKSLLVTRLNIVMYKNKYQNN